jgi:iron complex transport system substrate-binding protein
MRHVISSLRIIVFTVALVIGFAVFGVAAAEYPLTFVDDQGDEVTVPAPATRIIALYSAHTENLFSLGLDGEIIGVGNVDIYPPRVLGRPRYDYKSDPEKVIAADPDLVLIRPFIQCSRPEFVEALKKAGLFVVSLYPDSFDEFDDYIRKLAMLTGTQAKAGELLRDFHQEIADIRQTTAAITPKVNVYFESVEKDYKTVTPDSTAARTIETAGGVNIASDATPVRKGSSIASYGAEKLLSRADEIDVYVSQRGTMNAGGSVHSISVRPGFYAIKAVAEQRVYVINEKLISSPTFRHVKGVRELARMFYPEVMDDLSAFNTDQPLTRSQMAEVAVRFQHKPIFVPTSRYYRSEHKGHTYGTFQDVSVEHPLFDMIETAVASGYMEYEIRDDGDWFLPEHPVTREGFAKTVFMLKDLELPEDAGKAIQDLDTVTNKKIVQIIVGHDLMTCEDGYFHPDRAVTGKEALDTLTRLK